MNKKGAFMKKRIFVSLLLVFSIVLSFSSCKKGEEKGASAEKVETTSSATRNPDAYKIALVVESTIDDKGWCQAMYDGLLEAKKDLGNKFEFKVFEKMLAIDSGSTFRQCAAEGYDLILAHGAQYKNPIIEVAEEFPNISFAYGTSDQVVADNVFTYMPESEETGFLSGILAGLLTKSNIVGLVGPVDGGDAARYNRGYVMGVKEVNPKAKILVAHTGSFSDNVKASEIATSQIKNGADVLTGSSQQAVGALVATADSKDALWLGQDLAQLTIPAGKERCVAASSYNYAAVIKDIVTDLENGVKGGKCIPLNFNNGGFVFEFNDALSGKVTPEMRQMVEETLSAFKGESGILSDWRDVDYSKL